MLVLRWLVAQSELARDAAGLGCSKGESIRPKGPSHLLLLLASCGRSKESCKMAGKTPAGAGDPSGLNGLGGFDFSALQNVLNVRPFSASLSLGVAQSS